MIISSSKGVVNRLSSVGDGDLMSAILIDNRLGQLESGCLDRGVLESCTRRLASALWCPAFVTVLKGVRVFVSDAF